MASKKKIAQIQRRVAQELAENRMWRQVVNRRYWLCPYCGMVGAQVNEMGELPEMVTHHLMMQCTSWNNFAGKYVNIKRLEERAVDVMVSDRLAKDPSWKLFDESERWYCPYCCKGKLVNGLRTPEGMQNAKSTIIGHLRECSVFRGGRGSLKEVKEIQQVVQLENRINRLVPQVRRRLEEGDDWDHRWTDGAWICPFCCKPLPEVDISTPVTRMETAPRQMAIHLSKECQVYTKLPLSQDQPAHVLKNLPEELRDRLQELVDRMSRSDEDTTGEIDDSSEVAPLPAPKLELSATFEKQESSREDSPPQGRVQVARYAEDDAESDSVKQMMAHRVAMAKLQRQESGEEPPEEVTDPATSPPDQEEGAAQEPIGQKEELALQEIDERPRESITSKKRRAVTGLMQRARIRLMSKVPDKPRDPGLDVAVLFRPSKTFAGDFYFFQDLGSRKVAVGVYTLSMKGHDMVPLNERIIEKLRERFEDDPDPLEVLCRINRDLHQILSKEHFVTMVLGVLDIPEKTFQFANAGHCPPLFVAPFAGVDHELIRSNGIVLGRDDGDMFKSILEPVTKQMDSRDVMVLYSEGVVELKGGERENEFGTERLIKSVEEYARQDSQFLIEMLETDLIEHLGEMQQEFDLTAIALRLQ